MRVIAFFRSFVLRLPVSAKAPDANDRGCRRGRPPFGASPAQIARALARARGPSDWTMTFESLRSNPLRTKDSNSRIRISKNSNP